MSSDEDETDNIDWGTLREYNHWFEDALQDISKEFLKNYNGPTVWEVSNDDTWDKINSLFNGWNIHLG